jgi:hypothetical protein
MKRTIKQWCADFDINWYGQGKISTLNYDWKLAFGKGRMAVFSSAVKTPKPETHDVNGRTILVFPNLNSAKDNGKISEDRFKHSGHWVEQCLEGNVSDFRK